MTSREVEWDDQSQAEILALAEYESLLCSGCGGYLMETTDKDAEGRYVAEDPVRCHQCTAREQRRSAYMQAPSPHPEALMWPVRRR